MARRSIPMPQPPVGGTENSVSMAKEKLSVRWCKLTAILERIQEALVHELPAGKISLAQPPKINMHVRLVVTLVLLAGLLLEPQSLVEGVVQLGVRVRNLLLADECPIKQLIPRRKHITQQYGDILKSLAETCASSVVSHRPFEREASSGHTLLGPVILGKRTHHLRVLDCVSRQHPLLQAGPLQCGTHG